jgi:hypothetical protein
MVPPPVRPAVLLAGARATLAGGLILVLHVGGCAKAPAPEQSPAGGSGVASDASANEKQEPATAGEWREFHSRDGRVIRACMLDLTKDGLSIQREDGHVFTSSLALYSDADQLHAKQRKLDRLVSATLPKIKIPSEARQYVKKRHVVASLLGTKENIRDAYKSHIDQHGTLVGCRTLVVGQEARDHYAATLKEIEDVRFVLEFGAMLDAGID